MTDSRTGWLRVALASVMLALTQAPSLGEDRPALPPPPRISGDGRAVPHPPDPSGATPEARTEEPASKERKPELEHRSILLDLALLKPPRGSLVVSELAPDEAPTSLVRTYRGLYSIPLRRLNSYYRGLWGSTMEQRILGSTDSLEQLDHRVTLYQDADQDLEAGGRWWDRSWRQSLVPSRGGAPAATARVTVGRELEILRLGEFSLSNEGRVRGYRLSLLLDDDRIYERLESKAHALEAGLVPRAAVPATRAKGPGTLREDGLEVGIHFEANDVEADLEAALSGTTRVRYLKKAGPFKTPRGTFVTGDHWNLDWSGNIQLRRPADWNDLFGARGLVHVANFELDLNVFTDRSLAPWAMVKVSAEATPGDVYTATFTIQLATW